MPALKTITIGLLSVLLFLLLGQEKAGLCAQNRVKIRPFVVVLDAGHGGNDPGTVGNGLREKDITLSVALKVGSLINRRHSDVKVLYTRKTDVFVPLQERANFANRNHADLFISIHVNSAPGSPFVSGTETFVLGSDFSDKDEKVNRANLDLVMRENEVILLEDDYKQQYRGFDPRSTESYIMFDMMKNKHLDQSITLGSFVQRAYAAAGRNSSRGVKKGNLLVVRNTAMPSILTEVGFISNKAEADFMGSDAGRDVLADAITKGFSRYLADYRNKNGIATPSSTPPAEAVPAETDSSPESTSEEIPDTSTESEIESDVDKAFANAARKDQSRTSKPAAAPSRKSTACVYRIQLISTSKKLSANDREFRGYPVQIERIAGRYAYTTGCAASLAEAKTLQREIRKKFKDAFIVQYEGKERVKAIY